MIIARNLSKSFGKTAYLKDINLDVSKGSALAIVGENGAGKTTLLKILATVSRPSNGSLMMDGVDAIINASIIREKIGYVPQGIALMQELTVKDNLTYWMKHEDKQIYNDTLEITGLGEVEHKKVRTLSGGMKRRLNIGASLVLKPKVLILDEPLAGVDIANRRKIVSSLVELKAKGTTIIFTSHYIEEMYMLADELIALKDGKCAYYGAIDQTDRERFGSLSDAILYYTG